MAETTEMSPNIDNLKIHTSTIKTVMEFFFNRQKKLKELEIENKRKRLQIFN